MRERLLLRAVLAGRGLRIVGRGDPLAERRGGMCVRPLADASADEGGLEDADAADAGASGESVDAEMSDVAEAGDAMTLADTPNAAGSCGVILCAAGCTCTSPGASACTCP